MNFWKNVRFAALLFAAAAGSVLYTACQKDACEQLSCKNGGSCMAGYCLCRQGYEGAECAVKTSDRFVGRYYGYLHRQGVPPLVDTVDITLYANPDTLLIRSHAPESENLYGQAVKDKIRVPQQQIGYGYKRFDVTLENNKLTFYYERAADSTLDSRVVETFYGFK